MPDGLLSNDAKVAAVDMIKKARNGDRACIATLNLLKRNAEEGLENSKRLLQFCLDWIRENPARRVSKDCPCGIDRRDCTYHSETP